MEAPFEIFSPEQENAKDLLHLLVVIPGAIICAILLLVYLFFRGLDLFPTGEEQEEF